MYLFAMVNNVCIESVTRLVKDLLFSLIHCAQKYLSVHAFGRGDIHIENTSCHVFIHNVIPKDLTNLYMYLCIVKCIVLVCVV